MSCLLSPSLVVTNLDELVNVGTQLLDCGLVAGTQALLSAYAAPSSVELDKRCASLSLALSSLPVGLGTLLTAQDESVQIAERCFHPLLQGLALAPYAEQLNLCFIRALIEARRFEAAVRACRWLERARSSGTNRAAPQHAIAVTLTSTGAEVVIEPPSLPSLPCLLAQAQARGGDLSAAESTLLVCVQGDPDGSTPDGKGSGPLLKSIRAVTTARDKGNEAYKAGNHEAALAAYGDGQDTARRRLGYPLSFFHSNCAAVHMALNAHEDALNECMAALRAYPGNSKAWSRAATCFSTGTVNKPADYELAAAATAALQYLTPLDAHSLSKQLLGARARSGDESLDAHGGSMVNALTSLMRPLSMPHDDGAYQSSLTGWKSGKGRVAAGRLTPMFEQDSAGTSASQELGAARLVVVDWFATWCGPCKQIGPVFAQLAAGIAPASFVKVDGDLCKSSAAGLNAPRVKGADTSTGACKPKGGACCGGGGGGCGSGAPAKPATGAVSAFPTFTLFLDGEEIGRLEGADPARLNTLVKDGLQAWAYAAPAAAPIKLPGGTSSRFEPAPPALTEVMLARDGRADVTRPLANAMRFLGIV